VNGSSRSGFTFAAEALRVELDRDEVSARSRRGEPHPHGVAALNDHPLQGATVGVKHVASIFTGREEAVEVAARDRLSDLEGVVASWRRDLHPIQEVPGSDPVDQIIVPAIKSLSGARRELAYKPSPVGVI
jgi:hypothetical protein